MHTRYIMQAEQGKRLLLISFTLLFTSCILTSSMQAQVQILSDSSAIRIIRKGIDLTYNMQFSEAQVTFSQLEKLYPGHPVHLLIKGIMLYWENYPLRPSIPEGEEFERLLFQCIDGCERLKKDDPRADILLTNISARGMLLLYYTDNDMSRRVISIAPGTYHFLKRTFDYTSVSADFYAFTGLYKYYREKYPEIHPIYKPIAALFPHGNKEQGIKELEISATKSIFMRADSYSFLTWIFNNFEKDYSKATAYISTLSELYPKNFSFSITYMKNLLMSQRYDDAERLYNSFSEKVTNPFMLGQILVLNGLIQERKYKNLKLARDYYERGLTTLAGFGPVAREFSGLGYMGLSRICEAEGDQQGMRKNRRKAEEISGS